MILKGASIGKVFAKSLTSFLIISIPLSSDAFNSSKFPDMFPSPKISVANVMTVDVFPVPGGPANNKWGNDFDSTNPFNLVFVSS